MEIKRVHKDSFSVIGRLGSSDDGAGYTGRLWEKCNSTMDQLKGLQKLSPHGGIAGAWGLRSDVNLNYAMPGADETMMYLAGLEVRNDAEPPKNWTKWTVPANNYLAVKTVATDSTSDALKYAEEYMEQNKLDSAGAFFDYMHFNYAEKQVESYIMVPYLERFDFTIAGSVTDKVVDMDGTAAPAAQTAAPAEPAKPAKPPIIHRYGRKKKKK